MGDYRDDIPWPLKVPFWLVGMLFWGGIWFATLRVRVVVMAIVMVILCAYLFLGVGHDLQSH